MKGTYRTFRGRSLILIALFVTYTAALPVAVGASSTTATSFVSSYPVCGVVPSSSVHVTTTPTCVVHAPVGANVRIVLRSGWRWGTPVASTRDVIVRKVTRSSEGVDGATLHAAAVGDATIHVTGTVFCPPGVVCPALAILWSLRVIVTKSPRPATLKVTASDNGHTYTMQSGDRLVVSLVAASMHSWSEPNIMGSVIMRRASGRGGVTATGMFVAGRVGRTMVVALEKPDCSTSCLTPTHLF